MSLFDGLEQYEVILLVLGTVLFCVLLVMMVYRTTPKGGVPLFMMSFAMIAFPGIESVKFGLDIAELTRTTKELKEGGEEKPKAVANIQRQLDEIHKKPIHDPKTFVAVAEAQAAIGQREKALRNLDRALKVRPDLPEAAALKKILTGSEH
jgi:hypothetical protein